MRVLSCMVVASLLPWIYPNCLLWRPFWLCGEAEVTWGQIYWLICWGCIIMFLSACFSAGCLKGSSYPMILLHLVGGHGVGLLKPLQEMARPLHKCPQVEREYFESMRLMAVLSFTAIMFLIKLCFDYILYGCFCL